MNECFGENIGVVSDALRSKLVLDMILKINGGRDLIERLDSCGMTRDERVKNIRAHLLSGCSECTNNYLAYLDRKAEAGLGFVTLEGDYLEFVKVYDIFNVVSELRISKQSDNPGKQNS